MLPQLYQEFIRTGKVELIYLDLPLEMNPRALKPAEAAACAGEQGMFWDMHHYLFAHRSALGPEHLPEYAEELGLDVAAFKTCLASGQHLAGIREDVRTANNLGIAGTPAYMIGRRLPEAGHVEILEIIRGLPPYEVLRDKLNALLAPK